MAKCFIWRLRYGCWRFCNASQINSILLWPIIKQGDFEYICTQTDHFISPQLLIMQNDCTEIDYYYDEWCTDFLFLRTRYSNIHSQLTVPPLISLFFVQIRKTACRESYNVSEIHHFQLKVMVQYTLLSAFWPRRFNSKQKNRRFRLKKYPNILKIMTLK